MHIDKEQQNTSQATSAARSIENPVYTVSKRMFQYFQTTLKRDDKKISVLWAEIMRTGRGGEYP